MVSMTATRTAPTCLVTPQRRAEIMAWYAEQTRPMVADCAIVMAWALDHGDADRARCTIADTQVALGYRRPASADVFLTGIYTELWGR